MGRSGGGGGGGGVNWNYNYIHYAPYIEARHSNFLNTVFAERESVINRSPFASYTDVIVDDAFFGGGYLIGNFPSLYDMFGKFLAGLDIEVLWKQLFEDTVNAPQVNDLISAESTMMDEEIEQTVIPRFTLGMRDINSVMSSTFITGKAMIEDAKVKALTKYASEVRYRLIPIAHERWNMHLQWNQNVIRTYAEIMKLYYATKMDIDEANYSMKAKNLLWPFTVLDYERAALGALQGAQSSQSSAPAGASTAQKAIGGALTGAAAGFMASGGQPIGAVIGGALGLASGFL